MIEYTVKKGETLSSLAQTLGLPGAYTLKTFHNFKGPIERGIGNDIREGMILTIPEPHEVEAINQRIAETELKNQQKAEDVAGKNPKSSSEESHPEQEKEKSAGEHEGKKFVIQKGKAICDKGTKFPNFKVTSHKKHYINNKNDADDYLAVTENDLQFNPPALPFGNCSVKNGQPCSFAPTGKWQKFYKDVKVEDNALLTEISELQCVVGGKIKILDHGQKPQLSKQNFKSGSTKVHSYINPLVDLDEFNDELEEQELDAY